MHGSILPSPDSLLPMNKWVRWRFDVDYTKVRYEMAQIPTICEKNRKNDNSPQKNVLDYLELTLMPLQERDVVYCLTSLQAARVVISRLSSRRLPLN